MAVTLIEPDVDFKKQLLDSGGDTLKNCYQCGTCTVACPLSPDTDPFPRKELLWAQWGLKDRLMADPDVWLCHQCNDCAQLCPRDANPGDVLAVVRQNIIESYAAPGILSKMLASPKWLPVLFGVPAVLMLLVIAITGGFSAHAVDPDHHGFLTTVGIFDAGGGFKTPVNFDYFFAHYPITFFFTGFVGLSLLGAVFGLIRYWKAMSENSTFAHLKPSESLGTSVIAVIKDILFHKKFTECEATSGRYWGHMLLFYGFAGMLLTTTLAAILYYTAGYPFGWFHPVKLLGNISGIVFLAGLAMVIVERLKKTKLTPKSAYADWLFLAVIGLTVLTGIVCQAARLYDMPFRAYFWYFIHLDLVFFLLVYLPYSKFAHLLYRTVAMVYSRHSGRETLTSEPPSSQDEPVEQPAS